MSDKKTPLFDAYSLRARYFPAIIALLPLAGLLLLFHDGWWELLEKAAIAAIVGAALSYLVANVARSRGRLYETSFLERTGGWQSTLLLRHSNDAIDGLTKARYHTALGDVSGLLLPSESEERADPEAADKIYRSATQVLIERRRDPAFSILHSENTAYGFWRNLIGIRPIALGLSAAVAVVALAMFFVADPDFSSWTAFRSGGLANIQYLVIVALEGLYAGLFLLIVRDDVLLDSARAYAFALFKTLDSAPASRAD